MVLVMITDIDLPPAQTESATRLLLRSSDGGSATLQTTRRNTAMNCAVGFTRSASLRVAAFMFAGIDRALLAKAVEAVGTESFRETFPRHRFPRRPRHPRANYSAITRLTGVRPCACHAVSTTSYLK